MLFMHYSQHLLLWQKPKHSWISSSDTANWPHIQFDNGVQPQHLKWIPWHPFQVKEEDLTWTPFLAGQPSSKVNIQLSSLSFPESSTACNNGSRCLNLSPNSVEIQGWQLELFNKLEQPPGDRTLRFIVDPEGGNGKTSFQKYCLSMLPGVQLKATGIRDYLACMINKHMSIFLFNVPRGGSFKICIVGTIKR